MTLIFQPGCISRGTLVKIVRRYSDVGVSATRGAQPALIAPRTDRPAKLRSARVSIDATPLRVGGAHADVWGARATVCRKGTKSCETAKDDEPSTRTKP
jgi:hypothetical protein